MSATTVWEWAEEAAPWLNDFGGYDLALTRGDVDGHAILTGRAAAEHPLRVEGRRQVFSAEQDWVIEQVDHLWWLPVTDPPSLAYRLYRWAEEHSSFADERTTADLDRVAEIEQLAFDANQADRGRADQLAEQVRQNDADWVSTWVALRRSGTPPTDLDDLWRAAEDSQDLAPLRFAIRHRADLTVYMPPRPEPEEGR